MEKETIGLSLLDKAILEKLSDFQTVSCPTPKPSWWANLFNVTTPTIRKHFVYLEDQGYITKIDKWNYNVTSKFN
jgi:DeoR/GlpR family transcriptional regulator of sugar metabolism